MKKMLVSLFCLSMLFISTGCTEDETPTSKDSNGDNNQQETKREFSMDETVVYENVEYTVTEVERSQGNEWDKPKEGMEFVIVHIKIENKSDKKISYNVFDWKMQNSDGQEDSEAFTTINNDTNLSSGDLVSGGKKEGTIAFEQSKGDSNLKLNYYGNVFSDNYSFQISIK